MATIGVLDSITVEGEGRTVVLLHGGPGLVDYMGLLDAETAGWRRVRYQQRGHAPSAVGGPFTVQQNLEDLISVLDDSVADRCVVLGHSWGGHLALQAALAVPERIDGVALIDPFGSVADGGAIAMAEALPHDCCRRTASERRSSVSGSRAATIPKRSAPRLSPCSGRDISPSPSTRRRHLRACV
jgi:pimeloyl-ACP methyl ester carboxylesterase